MTYQEQQDIKDAEYKARFTIALEDFNAMRSNTLIRDEGIIDNAKECAKKHRVKFGDLLKTRKPGNNIIGQKPWDKNGKIYKLKS